MHGTLMALGMLALAAAGPGQPADQPHYTRVRLVAEEVGAQAGQTINLGVTFDIDDGWHLYWNGRNDSGFAPTVTLTMPEGFESGPVQWPAPHRHEMPGGLLDHIYEKSVTLIIPVHIPETYVADSAPISAHVEWMECSEYCLLADGDASLVLPIVDGPAGPSAEAPLFAAARERLPRPLPEKPEGFEVSWQGDVLKVDAPGATYLAFYAASEGAPLIDPLADGESQEGSLSLRFDWSTTGTKDQPGGSRMARGVLEVRQSGETPVFYSLGLPRGGQAESRQPGNQETGIR